MKKKFLIIILLLLINFAYAERVENYDNFKKLEVDVNINSSVILDKLVSNPRLDSLNTKLIFYPRNSYTNEIKYKKPYSNPQAEVKEDGDLSYTWKTLDYNKLTFGVESRVRNSNDFIKVRNKINFPIEGLSDEIKEYLKPTENIDLNDKIKEKAQEIVSGETDAYIATFKIAEWVRDYVPYDLNTLTADVVQKSSWVYENREGVCDEITSLFISMVRSVGMPARFVSGLVYTNTIYDFGAHGWAEVFFPGYGWVPFDVTFAQYGYVDSSHIKLQNSFDSKSNAVVATALSYGLNLTLTKYVYGTKVISTEGEVQPLAKISLSPIADNVNFGSYVPIEIEVENLQDYYLPLVLTVIKAPEVYKNKSQIAILLKPFEAKSVFFIVKVASDVDDNYIYTSNLEVKTNLNDLAIGKIKYMKNGETYTLKKALDFVNNIKEREKKVYFSDINLNCSSDKKNYYNNEKVKVKCLIENKGNTNLDNISICLMENCRLYNLGVSEKAQEEFIISLNKILGKKEFKVSAENDKLVKYYDLGINVFEIPNINLITNIKLIDYKEVKEVEFNLSTNTKISNVILSFNDKKVNLDSFNNSRLINLSLAGKDIKNNLVKIKLNYEDELNKTYDKDFSFKIEVINIPWYIKTYNFFFG